MSLLQSSSVFYQLSNYLQHTLQERKIRIAAFPGAPESTLKWLIER